MTDLITNEIEAKICDFGNLLKHNEILRTLLRNKDTVLFKYYLSILEEFKYDYRNLETSFGQSVYKKLSFDECKNVDHQIKG